MAADLPAPLTPPDCDLSGFDWMALLGDRLFRSTFYRKKVRKDPRGGWAGLKLWWEAMKETPAGSLPNDEEDLCMLADFGEDMKTWARHRDVAMHGWVLCSDGRLYHKTVAEQATAAWAQKKKANGVRQEDADRLRRWRQGRQMPEKQWLEVREGVFARDGGKCVKCGSTDNLHCDHILELSQGGSNDPSNLMTLCRKCHSSKTAKAKPNWNEPEPPNPGGNGGETHFKPNNEMHTEHIDTHFDTGHEMRREKRYEMRKTVQDKVVEFFPKKEKNSTTTKTEPEMRSETHFIDPAEPRSGLEGQRVPLPPEDNKPEAKLPLPKPVETDWDAEQRRAEESRQQQLRKLGLTG